MSTVLQSYESRNNQYFSIRYDTRTKPLSLSHFNNISEFKKKNPVTTTVKFITATDLTFVLFPIFFRLCHHKWRKKRWKFFRNNNIKKRIRRLPGRNGHGFPWMSYH